MTTENLNTEKEPINDDIQMANQQAASMMVSHMRLDEVLAGQLNGVVVDTEDAAMSLIMRGRKLSDDTHALLKHLESSTVKIVGTEQSSDQVSQDYKALFTLVTEHNASLAAEIAEMLGQIQFQDVVRQRIERIEQAVNKRNALFQAFVEKVDDLDPSLHTLPDKMQDVLNEYLELENKHAASINDESTIKIELF